MTTQQMESLRDRIADLLLARSGGWMQPIRDMPEEKAQSDADAILAALGLDDLDAAVERASMAIHEERFSSNMRDYGRAALEAVLTP